MEGFFTIVDSWVLRFLPADIYARLDFLYNGSIYCLGAGVVMLLAAVVFMIVALRRGRSGRRVHHASV